MDELRLHAMLAQAARDLRRAPVASLAYGAAVSAAFVSAGLGLGLVVLPWLLCELTAHQLHVISGQKLRRTRRWWAAMLLHAWGLSLYGCLALLGAVAAGDAGGLAERSDLAGEVWARVPALFAGIALAGWVGAPLQFAPTALVAGGRLAAALGASAEMFRSASRSKAWALATGTASLPLLAAVTGVALLLDAARGPLVQALAWLLLALAVLSVPLAGAWHVRTYRALLPPLRSTAADAPGDTAGVADRAAPGMQPSGAAPAPPVAVQLTALLALVLGPVLVVASLARPAPLSPGRLPPSAHVDARLRLDESPRRLTPVGTSLTLEASARRVVLSAPDGGGVGRLSPPKGARPRQLRLGRDAGVHWLEIETDAGPFVVAFDARGVRLDDSLARRLRAALPLPAAAALVVFLVVAGWALPRAGVARASRLVLVVSAAATLGIGAFVQC